MTDEGSRYSNKLFSSVFFRPQSLIFVPQLQCGPSREMFASAISNVRIEQDHHILEPTFDGWSWRNGSSVAVVETMCCFLSDIKYTTLFTVFGEELAENIVAF